MVLNILFMKQIFLYRYKAIILIDCKVIFVREAYLLKRCIIEFYQ